MRINKKVKNLKKRLRYWENEYIKITKKRGALINKIEIVGRRYGKTNQIAKRTWYIIYRIAKSSLNIRLLKEELSKNERN